MRTRLDVEPLESRRLLHAPAQPNIILLVTDDQRWDTVSYMPFLTSLAQEKSTVFDDAHLTTPQCCPSRSSILTGLYARHHGVTTNHLGHLFPENRSLAVFLDAAGYQTALLGKYLNGFDDGHVPPGWDHWQALSESTYDYYNPVFWTKHGRVEYTNTYVDDLLIDKTIHRLEKFEQNDAAPFFVYLAPRAPHHPATPAVRYADVPVDLPPPAPSFNEEDLSDKAAFLQDNLPVDAEKVTAFAKDQIRTLLAIDEGIKRIFQKLSDLGELDHTLFIFTSDNGYFWGEHRLTQKRLPYEEATRTPLIIYRGWDETSHTTDAMALNIDFTPTILAYAEAAGPDDLDGASLLPLLEAPAGSDVPLRPYFFMEGDYHALTWTAVRKRSWVLIRYSTGEEELYNLAADPWQLENVAPLHPVRTANFEALLNGWK